MVAVKIIVLALLVVIIIGGLLIYETDESEFRQVRCIDCKNWENGECDFDEICGSCDPEEYMSIKDMPYYGDTYERKTKKEKNKANPQRIRPGKNTETK